MALRTPANLVAAKSAAAHARERGVSTLCKITATAQLADKTDFDVLKDMKVRSVSTDAECPVVKSTGRQLVLLLTHWGDLSSWEYAQQIRYSLADLKAKGVEVVAIGIGSRDAGKKFAKLVDFPEENLYYDADGCCCDALGCSAGEHTINTLATP